MDIERIYTHLVLTHTSRRYNKRYSNCFANKEMLFLGCTNAYVSQYICTAILQFLQNLKSSVGMKISEENLVENCSPFSI